MITLDINQIKNAQEDNNGKDGTVKVLKIQAMARSRGAIKLRVGTFNRFGHKTKRNKLC